MQLSEINQIAVYLKVVPLYKALGFEMDTKMSVAARKAFQFIKYHTEDKAAELNRKIVERQEELVGKIREEFNSKSDAFRTENGDSFRRKMNVILNADEEFKKLHTEKEDLFKQDLDYTFPVFEIEMKEYGEHFKGMKDVYMDNVKSEIDGYAALLDLITEKEIIKIKE